MIRELKREIKKMVDKYCKLSFEIFPEKEMFPHCVAEINIVYQKEGLYNISLEIDVWDKNTSTKNVDSISEKIIRELDKTKYISNSLYFVCHFSSLSFVENEDKSIKRKNLKFDIQSRIGE